MPRITVSFKHTPEDLELYNEIMRHSDRSGYVKDVMKGHVSNKPEEKKREDDNMVAQLKQFSFG